MVLMLDEDESFSLTAYVTSPGTQRTVLTGYLVSRRSDGVYVAPIIPQLFYGASGSQLQTWRQNITTTGNQVIISRVAGGYPKVPKQDLYWRKIQDTPTEAAPTTRPLVTEVPSWLIPAIVIGIGAVALYLLTRH